MDVILSIFQSLGVDQTVFVQFATLIVIFVILSYGLFPKVKEVLDYIESKTTKAEGNSNAIYKKADELQEQYKAQIEKTHQEAQAHNSKLKAEVSNKEAQALKAKENEIEKNYDAKKADIVKEISSKKASVLAEAEQLSKNLLDKLTK